MASCPGGRGPARLDFTVDAVESPLIARLWTRPRVSFGMHRTVQGGRREIGPASQKSCGGSQNEEQEKDFLGRKRVKSFLHVNEKQLSVAPSTSFTLRWATSTWPLKACVSGTVSYA